MPRASASLSLRVGQVADLMQVSAVTARAWATEGLLGPVATAPDGSQRVTVDGVLAMLREHASAAGADAAPAIEMYFRPELLAWQLALSADAVREYAKAGWFGPHVVALPKSGHLRIPLSGVQAWQAEVTR